MRIYGPYQITQEHVERSSTLEENDVGRWALSINGSIQLFQTKERAQEAKDYIERP